MVVLDSRFLSYTLHGEARCVRFDLIAGAVASFNSAQSVTDKASSFPMRARGQRDLRSSSSFTMHLLPNERRQSTRKCFRGLERVAFPVHLFPETQEAGTQEAFLKSPCVCIPGEAWGSEVDSWWRGCWKTIDGGRRRPWREHKLGLANYVRCAFRKVAS